MFIAPHTLTSRAFGWFPIKAGLQTFLHSQAPSREYSMAFMLRSHNGVHCCGKKAGLQTFLHSQAPSQEFSMAFMLRSHNGVHCCGTVGDSHPSSQLSTAKCTFTGDSFQNHAARTVQTECNRARSNITFFRIFAPKKWQSGG